MFQLLTKTTQKTHIFETKIFEIFQNLKLNTSEFGPLPLDKLTLEKRSETTEENAIFTKRLTNSLKWILVSSEFH